MTQTSSISCPVEYHLTPDILVTNLSLNDTNIFHIVSSGISLNSWYSDYQPVSKWHKHLPYRVQWNITKFQIFWFPWGYGLLLCLIKKNIFCLILMWNLHSFSCIHLWHWYMRKSVVGWHKVHLYFQKVLRNMRQYSWTCPNGHLYKTVTCLERPVSCCPTFFTI